MNRSQIHAGSIGIRAEHLSIRPALALVLGFNAFRLALSSTYQLFPQEAYYFLYSQHPALSYFDHPPVIAWCIRAFAVFFGHREITLRLTAFVLTLFTQWVWLKLLAEACPRHARSRGFLLLVSTGLTSVVSLAATPDVPLLLFWSISLHLLYLAIFRARRGSWILAGLAMGLAFDSKYTGIFLQAGLALFLLGSRRHRGLLRTAGPYLAVGLAQLIALPVYWWNWTHHFASFKFQSADRAAAITGLHLRYVSALLGTQAGLLLPPLVFAVVWLAARLLRRLPRKPPLSDRTLFFAAFFLPMALVFFALSLFTLVKPNWLMPCYVSAVVLLAPLAARWWRWQLGVSVAAHILAAIEIVFVPVRIQSNDVWYGWRELAASVRQLSATYPGAFIFSADEYKTSAELSFYLDTKIYGPNVIGERGLQFDYLGDDLRELKGRDALWIKAVPRDFSPGRSNELPGGVDRFEQCEELPPILLRQDSRTSRKFLAYFCRNYRFN